jgi:hypothetical protein
MQPLKPVLIQSTSFVLLVHHFHLSFSAIVSFVSMSGLAYCKNFRFVIELEWAIINGREPRSCLGRVFNSKLGCIATLGSKCMVCMQPLLQLKTWPEARPVS